MERIPLGVQLYSVREQCEKDLPGTLQAIADMGYDGVEFAGYYGRSADELKDILDELQLEVCGTHIGLDTLLGDELEETIEFNKTLGNKFLIVPGLPEERCNSADAWRETAEIFNGISEKVRPADMYVGYHNHTVEFSPMDGDLPWDIFFGNTVQDVVMQLDTGNALHGGGDPVPYVERYPGRALTVHLKEHSTSVDSALVGEGDVDWERLFKLCETVGGTQWYIVEQESYRYPPLDCIAYCLDNLEEMGK